MAGFVDDGPSFMRSEAPEKLPDHEKYYRGEYYDGDPRYWARFCKILKDSAYAWL